MLPAGSGRALSALKPYAYFEPGYVLFNVAVSIAYFADVNLYLQKACRRGFLDREPDLRTPCDDEEAGVAFVATVNSRYIFVSTVTTFALGVLFAAWSDRSPLRRKLSVLCPMAVKLLQLLGMCAQAYFWHWPATLAALTEATFSAGMCMRLTSVVYVCGVSTADARTLRLTLLYALQMLTQIVGSGCSGYVLRGLGFVRTYVLCAGLACVSLVYVGALMRDSVAGDAERDGCVKSAGEFVDVRAVVEAFALVFRKRRATERTVISLLAAISVLAWTTYLGEYSAMYLYLRYKFGWNEKDFGVYMFYKSLGISFGSILCAIASKYGKISDSTLGIFAAFWDIMASVCYFFAAENWQLYLIPLLDIFHGFALNVCDSMQSKFFESHQFGRLFSVHTSLNILASLAYPAYNLLFKHTMNYVPQSVFLLSTSLNLAIFVLYGLCHYMMRATKTADKSVG